MHPSIILSVISKQPEPMNSALMGSQVGSFWVTEVCFHSSLIFNPGD